jgi:hypothetical protein
VDGITRIDWNIVETNHNVNTTRNVKVLGLMNNTNELSVNADNSLTITHYLLINGVVDLDGESQLIQTNGSDFDTASSGYLERDQQGEGNKFRYNDWSSPVYTATDVNGNYATIQAALKDGTNPASPGTITYTSGYDGATSPFTLSTYWMYKYANLTDDSYSSWNHIGSTGAVYAGEGFLMKGPGNPGASDQNYVFEGKPNNGDINLTVAAGNDYLVGNPYPSAIDADQFIDDNVNATTGTLYFWEHYGGDTHNLAGYQAGYATYTKAGGVLAAAHPSVSNLGTATKIPGRYIPVSQGFFVVGDADGGTIQFNNAQRIFVKEATGTSVFMKTAKGKGNKSSSNTSNNQIVDTRPKFRIGFNSPQIDHRQLLLTIDKNATDAVDWGYDAEIYEIIADDMYWMIGDKKYVIQATNTISKDKEIPLGIVSVAGGNITIKIDSLENITDNLKVYLKDKDLNQLYDLSAGPYQTTLPPGEYLNKYAITFKANSTLSVGNEELKQDIVVFMDNSNKMIHIKNQQSKLIKQVILYNMLGQKIRMWNSNLTSENIQLNINTSPGVYLAQVVTNSGKTTKKIVIN